MSAALADGQVVELAATDWKAKAESLETELAALRERADRAESAVDAAARRLERLNEAACVWADDNDLCSRFEDFCSEHGLQGRRQDYWVTVEARVQVRLRVDDARRDADESDLESAITSAMVEAELSRDLSVDSWSVESFEDV